MRSIVVTLLKFGLPLLIIGWLLYSLDREQLEQFRDRPVRWSLVGGAFVAILVAVSLSFLRWFYLVRALGLPFRLRDAFRLGFLGFLLNFVSIGAVGGDLFKAIFIAREQPGRRTLAVTSVLVDRITGLYSLFVVATVALLVGEIPRQTAELAVVRNTTFVATFVGGLGLAFVLSPGFTTGPLAEMLGKIPKLGHLLQELIAAIRAYRRQPGLLLATGVIGLGVHALIAVAVYWLAVGFFPDAPTLSEHLVIVPLSNLVGALPFTPAGLGTYEIAMETLYRIVPANPSVPGVTVALLYRLLTIGVAAIGVVVYWTSRREFAAIQQQARNVES